MNQQKLNELAERAWAYQITVYEDNGVRTYGEQEKVFSKQKFAELIIQECVSVINTEAGEREDDEYERAWKMGTEFAVYQIKQHFGVEE